MKGFEARNNLIQWIVTNVPLGADFSSSDIDYSSLGYSGRNSLLNALVGLATHGMIIKKTKGVYQFITNKENELRKDMPQVALKRFIVANVDKDNHITSKQIFTGSENFFGFSGIVSLRDAKKRLIASGFLKKVGRSVYQLVEHAESSPLASKEPREKNPNDATAEFLFLSPTENTMFDISFVCKIIQCDNQARFTSDSLVEEISANSEETEEVCEKFLRKLIQAGILTHHGNGTRGKIFIVDTNRLDYYMGHIKVIPVGLEEKMAELLKQQKQLKTELEKAQQAVIDLSRRLEVSQKIFSTLENVAALDDTTRADLLSLLNK